MPWLLNLLFIHALGVWCCFDSQQPKPPHVILGCTIVMSDPVRSFQMERNTFIRAVSFSASTKSSMFFQKERERERVKIKKGWREPALYSDWFEATQASSCLAFICNFAAAVILGICSYLSLRQPSSKQFALSIATIILLFISGIHKRKGAKFWPQLKCPQCVFHIFRCTDIWRKLLFLFLSAIWTFLAIIIFAVKYEDNIVSGPGKLFCLWFCFDSFHAWFCLFLSLFRDSVGTKNDKWQFSFSVYNLSWSWGIAIPTFISQIVGTALAFLALRTKQNS